MLCFPSMLVAAAQEAGMSVPPDPDTFHRDQYPHWSIFCAAQLNVPMTPGAHWGNAKIVAGMSDDEVKQASMNYLVEKGWQY